ncbi:IclR family transcriptional regulator [Chania multitudinisentens RB-25]|uniref:IclR family transcriptional regulator n=1 Tax=Chania multitudinisentens RB-25 TaxID=1441930 RepID=W0LGJ1_9GAMM|nr:IclR family transcriptional regulator [Chania multitudinisentens]AHG21377.1 IclR family transcriptional regulator [Chania multitudinisentens RB-25]
MTTLENATAVLKLFSQRRITYGASGISFSDVVAQLGLPKSTVSRLLQTMESQGMLERDPESRLYKIGELLLSVTSHYLSTPLVESAAAAMAQLNQLTFCAGYISMLEGRENRVMRTFPGSHFLQVVTPVGVCSPAAETSVGRAILARESDEQVCERFAAGYRATFPNSPQTLEALLQKLAQVRQQGWSLACNETLPGISSLATSVTNKHRGETVGLCLSFPSQSEAQPYSPQVLEALLRVSRQLAEKLGDEYWQQSKEV